VLLYHVRHAITLLLATILYCLFPNGQQRVETQNVFSEGAKCRKPSFLSLVIYFLSYCTL